jgi:molybdopterin molybdotransferase
LSGGSSAGNKDYTINIMDKLGKVMFHGIAIKPGKPTLMAECRDKYIIGLPGHPLSCAVVYKFIISKFIDALHGRNKEEIFIEAVIADNYHKAKGREEYLPVILESGTAHPLYAKSSAMSVMAKCSGFVRIGREIEGISKGQKVKVLI